MRLRITHDTRYRYTPGIQSAMHMAHLTPPHTRCQQRLQSQLDITPTPATLSETADIYRNVRAFFDIAVPHDALTVRATSLVDTRAPDPAASHMPWEAVQSAFVYHAGAAWHPAAEFIYPSVYVHPGPAFADYARPSFPAGRPLIDAARELMHRVHRDFTYAPLATEINTPAIDALTRRTGVCQDFSHVMLACLRALGLPARYVSCYLLTQPAPGQP
ncbi:MAG: transglutaminase family protein, partial [Pseudomonadota bacterium]|nr:transglutaminase family protein [Pseudomonadota bacterium]